MTTLGLKYRTSAEWIDYFRGQVAAERWLKLKGPLDLSPDEIAAVRQSLQIFQLGESGTGAHFLKCARAYALATGDQDYVAALHYFLGEEHDHAAQLGRILDELQIPRLQHTWTDQVFRWLRHRAGLELTVSVLLTAEVIAQVYYLALRDATQSDWIKQLCRQILIDEVQHVRFQSERLAQLRQQRQPLMLTVTSWCEIFLMLLTGLVVWQTHRRVFIAADMTWSRYWRLLWRRFLQSLLLRDPTKYCVILEQKSFTPIVTMSTVKHNKQAVAISTDKWLD